MFLQIIIKINIFPLFHYTKSESPDEMQII